MKRNENIDVILPLRLAASMDRGEKVTEYVLDYYRKYGIKKFILTGPTKKWRTLGFPEKAYFEKLAYEYLEAKNILEPYGIELGWWVTIVLKSGLNEKFTPIMRADGTTSPFANCPLDPVFRQHYAECIALFARIAKPSFIITEDDYSIWAAAPGKGCFCEHHLKEFSRRVGREYTRETLAPLLNPDTPEGIELMRRWRELMKDSLVCFAEAIRAEVDKETPEIPIGYMQAGGADHEGDVTYPVAKALAGPNHTPFSRLFGTFYGGFVTQELPNVIYHPIYSRQHIEGDFIFYHESDSYPSQRFFTSGSEMRAIMSCAYSAGFDGSTFQVREDADVPEETAYPKMFAKERARFNALHKAVKQCEMKGVEICYDPFYSTLGGRSRPYWTQPIAFYGIPFTTKESSVAFWDVKQATYATHETVMRYLSKGLFFDGEAAKVLCQRGYSKYLGASVDDELTRGKLSLHLAAKEHICDEFISPGRSKTITFASAYAVGREAKAVYVTPIDERCKTVTDVVDNAGNKVSAGMTYFENELGGKVVVFGTVIGNSYTHAILSYSRQRLFQKLLSMIDDSFVYVKDTPRIFTFANEAKDREKSGFVGILTLINLSPDALDELALHLSEKFASCEEILVMDAAGDWEPVAFERTEDGALIHTAVRYLDPVYIMFR
ncbi:MAG: hypothetical protein IJY39_06485 [Clostridia bacterium]|nr:hypothetical protein [Clostridia bacterium]